MVKIALVTLMCTAIVSGCSTGPIATTAPPSPTASPAITPAPSPTTSPGGSSVPAPLHLGTLQPGTYFVTPFVGSDASVCGPVPTGETPPPCPEATSDDSTRFTFTVPAGWAGAPFNGIWLDSGWNGPPDGAGMGFLRGGWLHSDPCVTQDIIAANGPDPDVPVGSTVDDFANALADNPILDVTDPVDVTLAGYSGKYVDLQVPSDLSGCLESYYPWEPGLYAQGPEHQWHLWILDVDGVRVVIQSTDYPGTPPQRQSELRAIVDSIQIEP